MREEVGTQTTSNENASAAIVPLVSFVVPCYNSASFMRRAVDSLLGFDQPCEILLINDGSKDQTSEIAHEYAAKYDNVIAIDQENANWGGVVNHGLRVARGTYFKVLDSDDYFDRTALNQVLTQLSALAEAGEAPDLFITNYVYDHMASNSQRIMQYRAFFPAGRVFHWNEMGLQAADKFIMIHAAWYKTSILRESNIVLPEGVSYMDGYLLLHPMPYTEKLFYLNVQPYHYIIGRAGQSVEIEVVKKHIDEQIMASRMAIDDADYAALFAEEPHRATLMAGYVSCMMAVSTLHLFMINTQDALDKNNELWDYLKTHNPVLYQRVCHSWAGRANRKTAFGRFLARCGYTIGKLIYKFA